MLYRSVPNTGDRRSILGFGCMRLPLTQDNTLDEARAVSQIRSAVDRGVNYLDTAWPYHAGRSEPVKDGVPRNPQALQHTTSFLSIFLR